MQKWEEERERERGEKEEKEKGGRKEQEKEMGKKGGGRKKKYEGGWNKIYSNSVLSTASGEVFFSFFFLCASLITLLPVITRAARLVCQPEKHQQQCEKIIIMKYNLSFALCSVGLIPLRNPLPSTVHSQQNPSFTFSHLHPLFHAFSLSLPSISLSRAISSLDEFSVPLSSISHLPPPSLRAVYASHLSTLLLYIILYHLFVYPPSLCCTLLVLLQSNSDHIFLSKMPTLQEALLSCDETCL